MTLIFQLIFITAVEVLIYAVASDVRIAVTNALRMRRAKKIRLRAIAMQYALER